MLVYPSFHACLPLFSCLFTPLVYPSFSLLSENFAEHWCSLLKDKEAAFSKCHKAVNPDIYYKVQYSDSLAFVIQHNP